MFPRCIPYPLAFQFASVRHLCLQLPCDERFHSSVPRLGELASLESTIFEENMQLNVQSLLDQASQLCSIQSIRWPMSLIEQPQSLSIRELDLKGSALPQYFNEQQWDILSRTALGVRCEVLYIAVVDRRTVFHLIHKMGNLRLLVVKCHDDGWYRPLPAISPNDQYLESYETNLDSMTSEDMGGFTYACGIVAKN